jgi:sulfhydrogenase subunit beta (sulfur reductase)
MTDLIVPKGKLDEILYGIMREFRLVAPVRKDGILMFNEVKDKADIVLTDEITYKSHKEFVFPQTEKILVFDENGDVESIQETEKTVILGVRPCDLEALKVMSAVFTKGKFTDTYFQKRLENTITIGLGCIAEKPGCFCSERGMDKASSLECDILLNDCGDYYTATVITGKGEELLKVYELEKAEPSNVADTPKEKAAILEINAEENILFNDIDWDRITEKCLGCGTCTFICPTCHCFEFKDVKEGNKSVRYKCWDSCMYPKFTLHTSGHNPRASKKERYRQRIMHKYHYVKENFGYTACSGCGRCIRSCPAGMNIKKVVKGIMEELK